MKRNMFDLTHQIHTCGELGRLQTLGVVPLVAGDSIQANLRGAVRLAATRRQIVQDAKVDIFCFFRPHRHTYGDDWVDAIKDGKEDNVNFGSVSLTTDGRAIEYLGLPEDAANLPTWLVNGYWDIYNWYFKNPDDADTSLTKIPSDEKERQYGTLIARLPHPMTRPRTLNTGVETDLEDADFQTTLVNSVLDVRDLAQLQAEAKTEVESNWYANRYPDIMKAKYGSTVSAETDERPTLVWHDSQWIGGRDIDGADDATMGDIQGKTMAAVDVKIPRWYAKEHGALWILAAVRIPTVHAMEKHKLHYLQEPRYKSMMGDPDLLMEEPPASFNIEDYITNGSNFSGSEEPYGQWYRYHPSRVHQNYRNVDGFPFLQQGFASKDDSYYHTAEDYDEIFQTYQLGHWQMNLLADMQKLTVVPGVDQSIKVGTKT